GDNPGGGGSGNTTWLVKSLIDAGIPKVFYGSFFDPELAAEAHRLGENAEFSAQFNRQGETEFSKSFSAQARVLKLSDGAHVGRLGMGEGRLIEMGPSAALEFNGPQGVIVIVISNRHQTADPVFFEGFGLEISDARIVVVKSRGHFRAGFYPWFDPEQVYEIDTPGLTAPVLERFQWKGLPRPVYPLDPDVEWNTADPFITE
ncbi:MAG: MlrC C-terminal domain-containing protein, partial [SAR324 cluster bacterium]|nr:MlrC C-terminal domain-containing protein [SAR324 cluster bacterium]